MIFPQNYIYALDDKQIHNHFPNLKKGENFTFTSLQTEDYNCVAWACDVDDEWIQFYEERKLVINVDRYIQHFSNLGYTITENRALVAGVQKIAIYKDNEGNFKHVAKQLPSGKWTSKLGDWEDIEHDSPEALLGRSYGTQLIFMEKV